MNIRPVTLLCSVLALLSTAAYASSEPVTATDDGVIAPLTESQKTTAAALRKLYQESRNMHLKSLEEYKAFMMAHVHDDVQFAMTMVNHIKGKPDQTQTLVLDKKKFEDSLDENYAMSQGADIKHKIDDVYVGADGKTARVTDITVLKKIVDMEKQGRIFKVEIQSQSTCDDILEIGDDGIPKIKQSTCNAENYFTHQQ